MVVLGESGQDLGSAKSVERHFEQRRKVEKQLHYKSSIQG